MEYPLLGLLALFIKSSSKVSTILSIAASRGEGSLPTLVLDKVFA